MTPRKVLLVDDEAEFVTTLAERLTLREFEVRTATDGETGLSLLAEERPEVVVLDVKMPGLSGLDVLERIRELHADLPVILLTGVGSTQDGIEGMRRGAFDFLMKPVDIARLLAKIDEAASAAGGKREDQP